MEDRRSRTTRITRSSILGLRSSDGFSIWCAGLARRGGGPTVRGGVDLRHLSWPGYRHVPLAEDLLGYRHIPLAEDLSSYEPA